MNRCSSRKMLILIALLFASACSSLNKLSTAQTDRLKGAPFYKSYSKNIAAENQEVRHFPVGLDGKIYTEFFHSGREKALQPLLEAMTAYLDSLSWSAPLNADGFMISGAPYVYVGSAEGEDAPPEAAMQRNESDKYPPMVIHIQKPGKEWKAALAQRLDESGGKYLLFINLGFSQYPKADKGLFEKKVVLGTKYEEGIKFLSAEDKPVEVLQVTGMLLDREGNILRAGSEGIVAKDTPFLLQIFDVQKSIDDETLRYLLNDARREDLPGKPLKWKVALHNLTAQMLPQNPFIIQ